MKGKTVNSPFRNPQFKFEKVTVEPDTEDSYGFSHWKVFVKRSEKKVYIGSVQKREGCWGYLDQDGNFRSSRASYGSRSIAAGNLFDHWYLMAENLGFVEIGERFRD